MLRLTRVSKPFAGAGGLLLLLCVTGCAGSRALQVSQEGILRYENVLIVYERQSAGDLLPAEAETVDADKQGEELLTDADASPGGRLRLTIEYPLPDGSANAARARLERIVPAGQSEESDAAAKSLFGSIRSGLGSGFQKLLPGKETTGEIARREEIGVYDFPRQELDLLIAELNNSGFFNAEDRPGTRTRLAVQINSGRMAKSWTPEPRLDHFIRQIDYNFRSLGLTAQRGEGSGEQEGFESKLFSQTSNRRE